ncbi:MAG: hypothetical protein RLZZ602_2122 [Pseudomonadota bacterium]
MTCTVLCTGLLVACGETSVPPDHSEASAAVNTDHAGHALWQAKCASCHRGDGRGNPETGAPAVNGLQDWYLERQLRHFEIGVRGQHPDDDNGSTMAAAIAGINNEERALLVDFMTELPSTPPATTLTGNHERGQDYINNLCSACHGTDGRGNEALQSPALTGLNDWYLVAQYEKFRAGVRGSHTDDTYGAQMVRFAPAASEDVVIDIAVALTQQPAD